MSEENEFVHKDVLMHKDKLTNKEKIFILSIQYRLDTLTEPQRVWLYNIWDKVTL